MRTLPCGLAAATDDLNLRPNDRVLHDLDASMSGHFALLETRLTALWRVYDFAEYDRVQPRLRRATARPQDRGGH